MDNNTSQPLADRMRPAILKEFVGQDNIIGKGKIFNRIINTKQIPSMILWGPPGSGKTTLARIIANETEIEFIPLSATLCGVQDVRRVAEKAMQTRKTLFNKNTVLFIDEIHRFNKAQQDSLLPYVETGTLTLIGATTENPSFTLNSALLSRTRVFILNPLSSDEIKIIIQRALTDHKKGIGQFKVALEEEVIDFLANICNGDARIALNALELAINTNHETNSDKKMKVTIPAIKEALQKTHLLYDRAGDEHYNTISAYIKSMRAGDVDAALYYLARMIEAGEDPRFIARRMVVFASEDIGMAQPTALVVANEVFKTSETIGYPECQINLAHGTVYLASQTKDRSAYNALRAAQEDVKKHGNLPIPLKIRNAPTKLMKELGYGKDYEMYDQNSLLPDKLKDEKYFKK